ncbi:NUDIX domain-containing protein [Paenibacillus pasadenensis]
MLWTHPAFAGRREYTKRYKKSPQRQQTNQTLLKQEGTSMEISSFGLTEVEHEKIKYVVLLAEYRDELVIVRNKTRNTWELPGGKRELDEPLLKAARRELYEETGAVDVDLTPYGIYLMNGSYGMNFHARIYELGELPDYEIAEIKFCKSLPDGLGYGDIYYKMYAEWNQIKDKYELKKYRLNKRDNKTTHRF